ncbi:hypothetical protein PoB_002009700 [Plakobranchus ocellatus]|uniref:Odorant receptor n=1 Tax=Plakobranchus ocellatus TaxID=259542 RepID=A0AAV3ZGD0_9GAST|nr:hypothetical protein PoB_002009700 [Plakobranchus ocellatus]
MMRISWSEKKRPNESVPKEAKLERPLIKTIRRGQLQNVEHICRHKGLEHLAISAKVEGTCHRGRQRVTFIESLNLRAISNGGNSNFRWFEKRFGERNMMRDICFRHGTWKSLLLQGFFSAMFCFLIIDRGLESTAYFRDESTNYYAMNILSASSLHLMPYLVT